MLAAFIAFCTFGSLIDLLETRKKVQALRCQGYDDDIALAFCKDCSSAGIDKIQSPELRRMKIEATFQSKPDYSALGSKVTPMQLYEAGLALMQQKQTAAAEADRKAADNAQRAAIRKVKEPLIAQHKHNLRFSECTGRDKHIAVVREAIAEEVKRAEQQVKVAEALKLGSRPRAEKNAYIAGGIAEGLGGTAAGVMTAADTMRSNEAIRQQNARTADARRNMVKLASSMEYSSGYSAEAITNGKYGAALAAAQGALVDTGVTAKQLMSCLTITPGESKTAADTGYVMIPVTIAAENIPLIGGELPGVIDGTLIANFMSKGQVVHAQKLPLPEGGIRTSVKVTLHCLDAIPDEKFVMPAYDDIQWAPYRLWLIEPLPSLPPHTLSPFDNMEIASAIGSIQL